MFPQPIEKTSPAVRGAYRLAVPILLLVWLLPIVAVAVTAARGEADIYSGNYWGWPTEFGLIENYKKVFTNTPMLQYVLNSFKVTIPTVIGSLALSCLAGFALGVYRFKMNLLVFFMFIGGNFVPFQILMVPVRDWTIRMGMYDSIAGLALFHIAFQTGFCTLFMRNFIRELPHELIEAARVEGASEFRIFWQVVLPLVRPALAALAVLIFTFIWNEYFWATVLISSGHSMPVTAGIRSLNGQYVAQWHLVSAGSILAALPPVAVFFAMQKQFIAGLTVGATKG